MGQSGSLGVRTTYRFHDRGAHREFNLAPIVRGQQLQQQQHKSLYYQSCQNGQLYFNQASILRSLTVQYTHHLAELKTFNTNRSKRP